MECHSLSMLKCMIIWIREGRFYLNWFYCNNIEYVTFSASSGFKIALHHHLDIPIVRQMAFNIAPGRNIEIKTIYMYIVYNFALNLGTETQVAVTPDLQTTTKTVKNRFSPKERQAPNRIMCILLIPFFFRDCYFQSEINLEHWSYELLEGPGPGTMSEGGRYSMTNCLFESILQVTKNIL